MPPNQLFCDLFSAFRSPVYYFSKCSSSSAFPPPSAVDRPSAGKSEIPHFSLSSQFFFCLRSKIRIKCGEFSPSKTSSFQNAPAYPLCHKAAWKNPDSEFPIHPSPPMTRNFRSWLLRGLIFSTRICLPKVLFCVTKKVHLSPFSMSSLLTHYSDLPSSALPHLLSKP